MTKKGRSLTVSSAHRPTVIGTGMPAGPSEDISRCSRTMSCADWQHVVQRGRRIAHARPSASSTRNVRFDRPPAIRVKVSGVVTLGTCSTNHAVTLTTLMPSGWLDTGLDANRCPEGRSEAVWRAPAPARCQ